MEVTDQADQAIYCGNFTLASKASPQDHVKVKRLFRQEMIRWSKRTGYSFGLAGQLHITSLAEAHWDHHCYTDAPEKPFREQVRDCWKQAGGRRNSLRRLKSEEDIRKSVRYGSKDVLLPKDEDRLIPAPKKICPLNHVWEIGGFWGGRKVDLRWSDLLDGWFPDRVAKRLAKSVSDLEIGRCPIARRAISSLDSTLDPQSDPQIVISQPISSDKLFLEDLPGRAELTPFQKKVRSKYLALRPDLETDLELVLKSLPYDLANSLGVSDLSERLDLPKDHVLSLLRDLKSSGLVVCQEGKQAGGRINAWHRHEWNDYQNWKNNHQGRK